jgi:hypothetical protein
MKTRCDYCSGVFGLMRRRYFHHQFCCEACERAYKEQRSHVFAALKSGLYRTLAKSVTRSRGPHSPSQAATKQPAANKRRKAA